MRKMFKRILLQSVGRFLTMVTVSSVNSMCFFCYGQEREPEQLQRFKK